MNRDPFPTDAAPPDGSHSTSHSTSDGFSFQSWRSLPGRDVSQGRLWDALPLPNQLLLGLWGLGLTLGTVGALGPPLYSAGHSAIYPYTAEGKAQTCASNLRSIYQAAALYAGDYEGRFPPLDTVDGAGKRRTWVSILRERADSASFQCPRARSVPTGAQAVTASYVMNPVLGGQSAKAVDDAARTLFLAEGGEKHDVSLLPPFPSWPTIGRGQAATSRDSEETPGSVRAEDCNFAFRHGEETNLLFGDGHIGSMTSASWKGDPATWSGSAPWGGSAVMRLALARLGGRDKPSALLVRQLSEDDVNGTARTLRASGGEGKNTSDALVALWHQNDGDGASEKVDRMGWNLARAWKQVGQGAVEGKMNREMARRCAGELQAATAAGSTARAAESGITLEVPANWKVEEKKEGHYRQTFVRSRLKDVFVLCEVGERTEYRLASPVDWGGMEKELRQKYGAGYKRLRLTTGTLAGLAAGVWEYEVDKPGSPRLHKLYVGHSGEGASYVVACTAPAQEFEAWRPLFESAVNSFRLN